MSKRDLILRPDRPAQAAAEPAGDGIDIIVVFTSFESTIAALRTAAKFAKGLGARITIVVAQIVPFPAPLTCPVVRVDWNQKRLRAIAETSPVETSVHVYLCRDRTATLIRNLKPHSLVVLDGNKGRWWPTIEERLARKLKQAGHHVLSM